MRDAAEQTSPLVAGAATSRLDVSSLDRSATAEIPRLGSAAASSRALPSRGEGAMGRRLPPLIRRPMAESSILRATSTKR